MAFALINGIDSSPGCRIFCVRESGSLPVSDLMTAVHSSEKHSQETW